MNQAGEPTAKPESAVHRRQPLCEMRELGDASPDGILVADEATRRFVFANQTICRMLGYGMEELLRLGMEDLHPANDLPRAMAQIERQLKGGSALAADIPVRRRDGSVFPADVHSVRIEFDGRPCLLGYFRDVTERKQLEQFGALASETLRALNELPDLKPAVGSILESVRKTVGCDAAGIRLESGGDFPYFAQFGFADDFLAAENSLVARQDDGRVCRDADGNVCLECTCGLVLSGKTDPANPLFTPGGSCWSNDTLPLLDLPSSSAPRLRPRNRCIHDGFASVALIPIHAGGRIVGLLQLNDRRKGCFTLAGIQALEGITRHIGAALLRLQYESQLRESENRYRSIFEQGGDYVFVMEVGADGIPVIVDANAAAVQAHGYDLEEIRGKPASILYPDMPRDQRGKMAALESGHAARFAERHRRRDGTTFDVEVTAQVVNLGGRRMVIASERDVTDRLRMQSALEDRNRFIESLLRAVPVAVFFKDREGRYLGCNQAFTAIMGVSSEAIAGRTVFDLWPSEQAGVYHQRDLELMRLREHQVYEFEVKDKDGVVRPVIFAKNVFCDANGEVQGLIGAFLDITEIKRLEERLRQSEKLDAIGQLAGGVAHDFNNQLAGILGYAELLLQHLADPALKQYAERIHAAATRSANLTRQLLAFARKDKLRKAPVDVHAIVAEAVALLERSLDKRIQIQRDLRANPHWVLGDPAQIGSAILNLALNARDAMPAGGLLTFATTVVDLDADPANPELRPGRFVQIAVTDTGHGMDAETLKHIFEPFFTTKQKGKGTGLGLPAAHGMVKNHCGAIFVASEAGKGTTFRLCLPAMEEPAAVPAGTGAGAETAPRKARILVVDDESVVRDMAAETLRRLGYSVTNCESGEAAKRCYEKSPRDVDLVILDVVMPQMDGHETLVVLRKINPDVRVILSSGHSLESDTQKLLGAGMPGFLHKPYTPAELAHKVAAALRGTGSA